MNKIDRVRLNCRWKILGTLFGTFLLTAFLFGTLRWTPKIRAEEAASERTAENSQAEEPADKGRAAVESASDDSAALEKLRTDMIRYGVEYLRFAQEENGGFSTQMGIGPSIIVTLGLLAAGLPEDDPTLNAALDFILQSVREDGGIYSPGGRIATYESCLALTCFNQAKKRFGTDRFDSVLQNGESFIRGEQYSDKNGTDRDDPYYGGLGYGNQTRPDLSNTQFFMETLNELGADADDEAIQNALVFVSRCQNLETEENPSGFASANPDGGFIYTCVGDGESPAGEVDGGLRSYGSMSYAGLKSLIYAGLTEDDPRLKAALGWLRENYSTTENPGLGRRGLYYYYHTMAKSLDVLGEERFTDAEGTPHAWRQELIQTLADAQQIDGSWVNDNRMWQETDPNLVTGYVLIVLGYCREKGKAPRQVEK